MGDGRKKLKGTIGVLKDKASLIKAILFLSAGRKASVRLAVLRATDHAPSSSPPNLQLSAVNDDTCIGAIIMDRLRNTRNSYVALKCLISLHHVIARGPPELTSFGPGQNFLNLATFRDKTDVETLELSSWVKWYAGVLERHLITSRVLGSRNFTKDEDSDHVTLAADSDLVREMESLVEMVEEICRPTGSLQCQRNDLVYEVVKLVAADYRTTQQRVTVRLKEINDRLDWLGSGDSTELTRCLIRLEVCQKRLSELFVNRNRNDEFWELLRITKMTVAEVKEERERGRLLPPKEGDGGESTWFEDRVLVPIRMDELLPYANIHLEWVHPTTTSAMA